MEPDDAEVLEAAAAAARRAAELGLSLPAPVLSLDSRRTKRSGERRAKALALKLAGLSFEKIGEQLEITEDQAEELIARELSTRAKARVIEQERELENLRLDRAQAVIWAQVLKGDLKAVELFLKISQARCRLNGLNAPMEISLAVSVRQEMEQALTELERTVLGNTIVGEVVSRRDQAE